MGLENHDLLQVIFMLFLWEYTLRICLLWALWWDCTLVGTMDCLDMRHFRICSDKITKSRRMCTTADFTYFQYLSVHSLSHQCQCTPCRWGPWCVVLYHQGISSNHQPLLCLFFSLCRLPTWHGVKNSCEACIFKTDNQAEKEANNRFW